jgi:hypothetical protein
MIVFDLKCGKSHVFEAWFGDSADYEEQRARGLLACPICGDHDISKALMTPNLPRKSNQKSTPARPTGRDVDAEVNGRAVPATLEAANAVEAAPEEIKAALRALAEMQAKVEATFENVGDAFPEEVRKIHYGEAEARGILGSATLKDAAELAEEGIAVLPLPFQKRGRRANS